MSAQEVMGEGAGGRGGGGGGDGSIGERGEHSTLPPLHISNITIYSVGIAPLCTALFYDFRSPETGACCSTPP